MLSLKRAAQEPHPHPSLAIFLDLFPGWDAVVFIPMCMQIEMFPVWVIAPYSTMIIYGILFGGERERNVLFNDALNTFLSTVIWRQTYG